jgi:hypothetical protein
MKGYYTEMWYRYKGLVWVAYRLGMIKGPSTLGLRLHTRLEKITGIKA